VCGHLSVAVSAAVAAGQSTGASRVAERKLAVCFRPSGLAQVAAPEAAVSVDLPVALEVVATLVSLVAPGLGRLDVAASDGLLADLGLGAWQKRGRVRGH
jgi:hypothetical protein